MKLFITGFLYVFLMAVNTYLIAKEYYHFLFISAFLLSWVWTSNVKKLSVSTTRDRLYYASGASIGCLVGVYITSYLLRL